MINSDFVQTLLGGLRTSYATINAKGEITAHNSQFSVWIAEGEDSLAGKALTDVLPELAGQETELEQVSHRQRPFWRLDHINRATPAGDIRYLTFTAIPGPPEDDTALIILVTDVTEQGEYLQELTQSRNELQMTRRRLAALSYQLDYLLRHYLAPDVADALLKGELDLELGGDLREVSILFADVRNFTYFSERSNPAQVVQLLNNHLNIVSKAIEDSGGVVAQFQGDNVIAIFNFFGGQSNHAQQSVQAGIAIQQALAAYYTQLLPYSHRLEFGVGINTGLALIGNIGAHQRYNYTAIGDSVNLAARITAVTPAAHVWISQTTFEQLPSGFRLKALPSLTFKGRSQPTQLFQVIF